MINKRCTSADTCEESNSECMSGMLRKVRWKGNSSPPSLSQPFVIISTASFEAFSSVPNAFGVPLLNKYTATARSSPSY